MISHANAVHQTDSVTQQLIGKLLLDRGLITENDLKRALELQKSLGGRLGGLLIRVGAVSEDALLPVLSEQLGMPVVHLGEVPDSVELSTWLSDQALPMDWWLDQETIAWPTSSGHIRCVTRDPLNAALHEILASQFRNSHLDWCLIRTQHLEQLLDRLTHLQNAMLAGDETGRLRELAEDAPVIEFVSNIVSQAFDQNASDIHIEPDESELRIRFRIDGILQLRANLNVSRFPAIASRLKLVSGMDIAEQRRPQDGQFDTRVSGEAIDVRVSSLPGIHGESIVLCLLPKEKKRLHLAGLGLSRDNLELFDRWMNEPHGIVLVTGPTGSGKSTTLYALLESINNGSRKIITVEDPVEYRLPGITQVQTHSGIDYGFARALRAILRQDPDVIMIGEIRDQETAEIAIQSSLTGHLVLATLHTNDAVSAFTRLVDMGIEPFLVATPVRAVMAQRLVRRLCSHCARPSAQPPHISALTDRLILAPEIEPAWHEPVGCELCHGQGYSGRIGIHELVPVTTEIQEAIVQGAAAGELAAICQRQGIRSLRADGLSKAMQGLTSVDEVLRVTTG